MSYLTEYDLGILPTYARNAIETPDGTLLVSRTTHDYVSYKDTNGEEYVVDGGMSYLRRNKNSCEAKDMSVRMDDPFEQVREAFEWGTYGKNSDQALKFVKLSSMSNAHLQAIIDDGYSLAPLMKAELLYRKENNYYIEE